MRRRLRAIGYGARRALAALARRPGTTMLVVGAVALVALVAGAVQLAARNLDELSDRWGSGVQMVVYLDEGADAARAASIADALRRLPAVDGVAYVSPEAAHERLRRSLGGRDDVLVGVEVGALPASIEVTLRDGVREVAAVHPVVERLRAIDGVEEVEVVDDWVAQVTGLVHAARTAGVVLALLAAAACIWVIAAAVRLGLSGRAGEGDVLRLVGASSSFVRGPLLLEGALQGAAGAAIAALLLWTVFSAGAPTLETALSPVAGEVNLVFLSSPHVAALVVAGALLGLVGGAAGARRGLA